MLRIPMLATAGLLFFTACADNANTTAPAQSDDQVAVESTAPVNDPSTLPDPEAGVVTPNPDVVDAGAELPGEITLGQTLGAVEAAGGVTQLPPQVAVSVIDGWIVRLEDEPAGEAISSRLGELRALLTADAVDGPAVAKVLSELGSATTAMSGNDAELAQLGDNLSTSSTQLIAEEGRE